MLLQHVEYIMPDALESSILKSWGFEDMCALLQFDFVHVMQGVGLNCTNSLAENVVSVRKVVFIQKNIRFVTRVMPYTASKYLLSLKKANVEMDEEEFFTCNDKRIEREVVASRCHTAYFLQKRCTACGAITEGEKKAHSCNFFSVVACEMHTKNLQPEKARMALAYVEFKLNAQKRDTLGNSPCVCVHLITPTRILSACYSVIDALWCILSIVSSDSLREDMPFPTFMRSIAVDIMSLPLIVQFYRDHVLVHHFNFKQIAAIVDILFMVGEYVLKTAVASLMIVPFIPENIQNPDVKFFFVKSPMREIVSAMQVTQLTWHVYASPAGKIHAELVDSFFNFVSQISTVSAGVKVPLEPWTLKYALAFSEKNDKQKLLTPKSKPLVEGGLARLLDAVRCFSYAQQLIFYTETLHITDVTQYSSACIQELELRFLLLFFSKGLSQKKITFTGGDVCDILYFPSFPDA